ncbi:hypothetical protein, partial [Clostridium tarantellae]|uniref:hypothetical protein n=1 Tax=Clostridium tarantellae TaxID=39493 RepID=UPI0014791F35
ELKSQINNINEIICRFISNIILTLLDEEHDNAPELNAEEIKLHNINEKISKKLKEKNIAEKIEEYLKVNYKVDSKHLVEIVNSAYKNDKLIDLNKLINNYIEISNGDKYLLNDNDIRILNEIEVILEELYFDVSMDVISLREQ